MKKINPGEAGLALGGLLAVWHAVWAVLVMMGFAKPLLDFILSLHFLSNPYQMMSFNLMTAVTLVVVTGIMGYVIGLVFGVLWNSVAKK